MAHFHKRQKKKKSKSDKFHDFFQLHFDTPTLSILSVCLLKARCSKNKSQNGV